MLGAAWRHLRTGCGGWLNVVLVAAAWAALAFAWLWILSFQGAREYVAMGLAAASIWFVWAVSSARIGGSSRQR